MSKADISTIGTDAGALVPHYLIEALRHIPSAGWGEVVRPVLVRLAAASLERLLSDEERATLERATLALRCCQAEEQARGEPHPSALWRCLCELAGARRALHDLPPASAEDAPAAPARPAAAPAHGLAPRVLELLAQIGVDPSEFHQRGRHNDPRVRRALAARRAVTKALRGEGWTVRRIADGCRLDPKTVQDHLRSTPGGAA